MKRIIFILTALLTSMTMMAAPALRKTLTMTQHDGTTLTIGQVDQGSIICFEE